jgi:hypothetical protein
MLDSMSRQKRRTKNGNMRYRASDVSAFADERLDAYPDAMIPYRRHIYELRRLGAVMKPGRVDDDE